MDGSITILRDFPSSAAMIGRRGVGLSSVCGTILPGMLSVNQEGAREKGEKGHVPRTALAQPFPEDLHRRESSATACGAPDGCATASSFPCPGMALPRSLAAERPVLTSPCPSPPLACPQGAAGGRQRCPQPSPGMLLPPSWAPRGLCRRSCPVLPVPPARGLWPGCRRGGRALPGCGSLPTWQELAGFGRQPRSLRPTGAP